MPLYTYVVAFKGAVYTTQDSYSNFKGFTSIWSKGLPENALPGLTQALRNELLRKSRGNFEEVPNRKHVWKTTIDLSGHPFVVHAIQTQP